MGILGHESRAPVVAFAIVAIAGCGFVAGPDKVAKQYLELGAAQDLEGATALVEEGCKDDGVLEVNAVRMMGIPMTIDKLSVELVDSKVDKAQVDYMLEGSVDGKGGKSELMGIKVEVDEVSVGSMTKEGTINLVKRGLSWKVACP